MLSYFDTSRLRAIERNLTDESLSCYVLADFGDCPWFGSSGKRQVALHSVSYTHVYIYMYVLGQHLFVLESKSDCISMFSDLRTRTR